MRYVTLSHPSLLVHPGHGTFIASVIWNTTFMVLSLQMWRVKPCTWPVNLSDSASNYKTACTRSAPLLNHQLAILSTVSWLGCSFVITFFSSHEDLVIAEKNISLFQIFSRELNARLSFDWIWDKRVISSFKVFKDVKLSILSLYGLRSMMGDWVQAVLSIYVCNL